VISNQTALFIRPFTLKYRPSLTQSLLSPAGSSVKTVGGSKLQISDQGDYGQNFQNFNFAPNFYQNFSAKFGIFEKKIQKEERFPAE